MRGATRPVIKCYCGLAYFNPRTPCGVRRQLLRRTLQRETFQSTHPLRGATLCSLFVCVMRTISIHAPLAGCDYSVHLFLLSPLYFNPRTPCGVRLLELTAEYCACDISIHAPLAGCDQFSTSSRRKRFHFNPRTPCGVRPLQAPRLPFRLYFNPRTPCGVRQINFFFVLYGNKFQSTHPLRGATTIAPCKALCFWYFNPRTPCGVRPLR